MNAITVHRLPDPEAGRTERDDAVQAVRRLVRVADTDTGQGRRAANFLLAWWNADLFGGFDLTDLWNVDAEIAADMLSAMALTVRERSYPDEYVNRQAIVAIIEGWRPKRRRRK